MSREPASIDADRLIAEGRSLRALARSLLDADRADDLVQDSFVAALRQRGVVRSPGPWLTGVVTRLAARWRRSDARRSAREQRVVRDHLDAAADPARIAAEAETLRAIAVAVHELDEPFRTVVVLRFWHDATASDIAARLGVPAETVRTRLFRGLERLRARLDTRPGGRAAWGGSLGAFASAKKAAGVAAPAAAMLGAGILMNTKLLLGGTALVVTAAIAVTSWPAAAVPIHTTGARAAIEPAAAHEVPSERVSAREAVADASAAASALQAADPYRIPWLLRVQVVDGAGRPIDGASVRLSREDLRREDEPFATLHTDALGNAAVTLAALCVVVRAEHEGATSLEQHAMYPSAASAPVLLRIEPPVALRGKVVRPDGSAAAGAVIDATSAGVGLPPRASGQADANGAFELRVPPRCTYRVQATLDGVSTFPLVRRTYGGEPPPLLLTFPGSISVRGTVVDADGTPMPKASVRVWHAEWRSEPTDEENLRLDTDEAGRFQTVLLRLRRYGVLASAKGSPSSEVLFVEPTPERPHVEVVVRLPRFAKIAGTVRRTDGSPLANARVNASTRLLDATAEPEPERRERFQTGGEVGTDAHGRFELRVHPAIRWTVILHPSPDTPTLEVRRGDVAPGTTDCTFVVDDEQLRGCAIVATVTAPAGVTARECAFSIEDSDGVALKYMLQRLAPAPDDEHLRFRPLGIGRTIALQVTPPRGSGLAPLRIAPLHTIAGELRVDVGLQRFAEVDVRVEFPHGRPVWVSAKLADGKPCLEPVRADGTARLRQCCPGDNTLTIGEESQIETHVLWRQQVVLGPGENPAIVVTVPSAKTAR